MNCKITVAALCMLSFRASYGMSEGVAFLGRIYSDAWKYYSQEVCRHSCYRYLYLLNEKDENAIISLIKNRKIAEAKALIKELFYDERIKRAITPSLISNLTGWHMDQEVLCLVIEVVYNDLCFDDIIALAQALPWAAQEGHMQVIESLNRVFNHLDSSWYDHRFAFEEESHGNDRLKTDRRRDSYSAICSGYIKAFDRAAYNGQIE
ncbi:hypothetical protein H0W26_04340, partial [Candidatus Dependentiae bacterium]|nr:hypothetical protein [Candidatus Dependentiae bacterium]